ncbi:hypothetical protein L596_008436 [Steinernema carpocapsae]|uniref:Saposin B-type domain-containing protein n=1 Tax=Steinernema carpocapsae TaxID=34508 RepID=A0A4V6A6B1_STECR|nr:hypothetical protein L596_008436 [Steinernema carpocapsae]
MKLTVALFCLVALVAVSEANFFCNLCVDFVQGLEKELEQGEGSDIDKANKVCDKLTHDNQFLDPLCKSLIDTSIEDIIAGIEKKEPPQKICKKIHIC